ncbi:hypothetical protein [Ornithinimicrobium pekingense]|uniref:DUF1049 domain-containing protein n=1 Tax=Ornithinimicrobium pekingense TaxID=384677 RepID=A0ABQ2F7Z4_9MICO|nr:hypothetical protein [Ornithinimicrobium pekingense]GGK70964.1 hypothetical protein GCM10011509_19260 [Ornithinimicrobium pekingense]
MLVILGLVLLLIALIVGIAGVLTNSDPLTDAFSVFGFAVDGTTGTLFLYGIVVGAVAMLGLSLVLAGASRSSRRGHDARRGLKESRRETASAVHERDNMRDQRNVARGGSST